MLELIYFQEIGKFGVIEWMTPMDIVAFRKFCRLVDGTLYLNYDTNLLTSFYRLEQSSLVFNPD